MPVYPPVPVTGRSLFSSSAAMTFQRPTIFSLSIDVTRRLYTVTLGSLVSSPLSWISSASFFGFGGLTRTESRAPTVLVPASLASGSKWPLSWRMRLVTCKECQYIECISRCSFSGRKKKTNSKQQHNNQKKHLFPRRIPRVNKHTNHTNVQQLMRSLSGLGVGNLDEPS